MWLLGEAGCSARLRALRRRVWRCRPTPPRRMIVAVLGRRVAWRLWFDEWTQPYCRARSLLGVGSTYALESTPWNGEVTSLLQSRSGCRSVCTRFVQNICRGFAGIDTERNAEAQPGLVVDTSEGDPGVFLDTADLGAGSLLLPGSELRRQRY